MSDVNETPFRDRLLAANQSGSLMEAIAEIIKTEGGENRNIAHELAILHNDNAIDLVKEFSELKRGESGPIFFHLRNIFEHALPEIENDVLPIIQCVQHLTHEAGHDLAASNIIGYFIAFLAKKPTRPDQALSNIKDNAELYDLLPATLIAGYKLDTPRFLKETLQLTKSKNANMRRQALFALGGIEWSDGNKPPAEIYAALEEILSTETSDDILAITARTAATFIKHDPAQADRLVNLVTNAVRKGGHQAIHAAAALLATVDKNMPEDLIEKLLDQLNRASPDHKGTIDQIDLAIYQLIALGKTDVAIHTLETLISRKELQPSEFDSALHAIQCDSMLRNKAATRWLRNGNASLCETAYFLIDGGHGANLPIELDPTEIDTTDGREMIFLAKKICGYFFMNPVSTASMLLSALQLAQDHQTRSQIGQLILNPLLINYPGKAREFINERRSSCPTKAQEVLQKIDTFLEEYFESLRSMDEIPELNPSEAQREAYNRKKNREMEESFKEAEKQSVFLSLVTKQTILYGGSSVSYSQDGQGNPHRQEIPLHKHSFELEVPRMLQIDPLGIEQLIMAFRAEKRQK